MQKQHFYTNKVRVLNLKKKFAVTKVQQPRNQRQWWPQFQIPYRGQLVSFGLWDIVFQLIWPRDVMQMSRQDAGSGFHVLSSTGINNDVTLLKVDYDPQGRHWGSGKGGGVTKSCNMLTRKLNPGDFLVQFLKVMFSPLHTDYRIWLHVSDFLKNREKIDRI